MVMDYADAALLCKDAAGTLRPLTFDAVPPSCLQDSSSLVALNAEQAPDAVVQPLLASGARLRRLQVRHESCVAAARRLGMYDATALHAVVDLAKELPEDGELDLSDIPGVAPVDRTSF